MPRFKFIQDPITLKESSSMLLKIGTTPNDFKKILFGEQDFPLPTICSIDKKGCDRIYLGRQEWDYIVQDDEICSFTCHPQAEAGVAIAVSLAISLVVGVATYLLTPKPNLNLNQIDKGASPTYDLTQQGNKVRLNLPIPVGYGTIRTYPDVASNPYTETETSTNNRIFHTLLNVGWGKYGFLDFKIDDTDLSTLDYVDVYIRSPGIGPSALFPNPIVTAKEVKNINIIGADDNYYVLNDRLSLVETIVFDFVAPQGISVARSQCQDYGSAIVASQVNIDLSAPGSTIDGVSISIGSKVFVRFQTIPEENGLYESNGPAVPMTRYGMTSTSAFRDALILIANGTDAGKQFISTDFVVPDVSEPHFEENDQDNDTYAVHSMPIEVTIQEIDDDGADVGSPIIEIIRCSAQELKPLYFTGSYTHGTAGRFKAKIRRTNAYNSTQNGRYIDELEWIGFKGLIVDPEPDQDNMTMIEIAIRANGRLNDSNSGIFNFLNARYLWVYDFDTDTWSEELTNSPVWAFFDFATSSRESELGLGYKFGCGYSSPEDINDTTKQIDLQNISDILDLIENEGYECNTRIDTAMSGDEALSQIAQSMRCIVYKRGGKHLLAYDAIPASLQGFFTRTNTSNVSVEFFTKTTLSATWFKVTYFDEETGKKETVDCIIAGESTETGNVEEIELKTITNRLKAWKYGQYLCAQNRYHTTKVRFTTDMEGFLPNPMDHISFAHPILTPDNQHGYVQKVDSAVVYLSEPVNFDGYASGLISFKNKNGTAAGPYVCSPLDTAYKVQLVPFDTNAEDYTLFTFHTQEDQESFEPTEFTFGVANSSEILVIKSITPSGSNSANIDAVIRDNRVYTAGIDEHNMPDYDTDTSVAQWYPYVLEAVSMTSNVLTKENILDWNGNGYSHYTLRYLYDDSGTEELDDFVISGVNTPVTPTAFNHTYTHTYSAPPSRVTITPRVLVEGSTYQELPEMAIVIPIQLV